jgi:hypothetical protein
VQERAAAALSASPDRAALRAALEHEGLELYIRGSTPGVIDRVSGKKHRLKTLDLKLWEAFEALPEVQLIETREKTEPEGEKEKGALLEADRHQSPEPKPEDHQQEWRSELKALREAREEDVQATKERSNMLLRELKALVRFAVSDTLRGIRSRALRMLERLKLKPRHYDHERPRRDPNHQRGR